MIEAIFWDNDGVLVDTETLFFETTRSAFAELGLNLTKKIWGALYLGAGKSSREIALSLGAEPARVLPVMEERNRRYRRVLQQPPSLRPQVRSTLEALHGRVKMALVTGCDRDLFQLAHATSGLLGFFEFVVTGDDCVQTKPHPEPYLAAIKALKVSPARCLAIEDSPRGLASATAAGVACVVVPTELTQDLEFAGAKSIEQDVSAVLRFLEDPMART